MKRAAIFLFWWFLAVDMHSITVVGPFADRVQCRQIQTALYDTEPLVKVSACWSDQPHAVETPTVHR